MAVISNANFCNYATGRTVRGRLYPPGGGSTGQDFAFTETPAGSGQYQARATLTVADTTNEPTQIEVRDVVTQDAAGFNASTTVIVARSDYSHAKSNAFVPFPPDQYTTLSAPAEGTGDTAVTHDTGGTDNLRVMSGGQPVDNAQLRAYLTSDYAANATTATVRANSTTNAQGRWVNPMYLDTGFNYTIVAEKPGVDNAQALTVDV